MNPCPYCDEPMTRESKDHIIPKTCGGGALGSGNIARVCQPCNSIKGNMTPSAMRALADDIEVYAARVRKIADRVDLLIAQRGLRR